MTDTKKIHFDNRIDLKEIFHQYDIEPSTVVSESIGYDGNIYYLLCNQVCMINHYALLILYTDWSSGNIVHTQYRPLGEYEIFYHFALPIGDNIIMVGARCQYRNGDPEKNALIISHNNEIIKEFCLGDGIEDCLVTDDGRIIVSYFDEGVFGNLGWYNPIGASGLSVWNDNGEKLWESQRPIYDCYAVNMDDSKNLWYYYYDEFKLIRTDFITETEFIPQTEGSQFFLITADGKQIIIDGGYDNRSQFFVMDMDKNRISNSEVVEFYYNKDRIPVRYCHFSGSKALLTDENDGIYLKQIFTTDK